MKARVNRLFILTLVLLCMAGNVRTQTATKLLDQHTALHEQLTDNPFGRPLYLQSQENRSQLQGEVYAEINQPFDEAGPALQDIDNWCDILILPFNTKSCRAISSMSGSKAGSSEGAKLKLHIGRKTDQPLSSAQPIELNYSVTASTADYVQVNLQADEGPLGTSNYRITLELSPLNSTTSFMHLSYSYSYGLMAKLAMQGYLKTAGRSKVGFSLVNKDDDQEQDVEPKYVGGMRGVIERNTMRYYFAIDAFLSTMSAPSSEQIDLRLNTWFSNCEQYPLQLHEIERNEYLTMKRDEIQRQRLPEATE